jgi:hypothetical protein
MVRPGEGQPPLGMTAGDASRHGKEGTHAG